MTLLEKLAEAKENLTQVKTAAEANEKTADELNDAIKAVKDIQAQIVAADEAEDLIKGLEGPVEEKAEQEEKVMNYKTIGEAVAAQIVEGNINPRQPFSKSVFGKSAAAMTTPSSISPALTDVDTNMVMQPKRKLEIRNLFAAELRSNPYVTYFVESATVEGGPDFTTEGTEKPMISFGDPSAVTVALKKIASHLKESEEMVHDAPWLATAINQRALYQHDLKVENYLVNALSGTSGIGTSSLLTPDGIFRAMMTVQKNSNFEADAIVINPSDYENIRLRKDNNGQYLGGGFITGAYANGSIPKQPDLWGLKTILTTAVPVGTCFVGAFGSGASVVTNNEGKRYEVANQNEDDFIKNMITIRIEERLVLAVRYPAAFVKITGQSTSTEA